jgi:hypothetical protein
LRMERQHPGEVLALFATEDQDVDPPPQPVSAQEWQRRNTLYIASVNPYH